MIEYWNQADTGCVVANFMMGMFSQFILPFIYFVYIRCFYYISLLLQKIDAHQENGKGLERIPIPKSASTFTLIFILIKSVIIF